MQPSGAVLQIPLSWTSEYDAVVVTRPNLKKVVKGRGEWTTEFAKIVNEALPFAECSVQAWNQRWDSPGFDGLQMRGYVIDSPAEEIEKRIATQGFAAAKKLPWGAAMNEDGVGQWHRILITYDLWYGDYGGKANVQFYLTTHDEETIVLAFMYAIEAGNVSTMQQILFDAN
jgi:hypothetical protein